MFMNHFHFDLAVGFGKKVFDMKLVTVTTLLWLELGILAVIFSVSRSNGVKKKEQRHSDSLFESFESGYVNERVKHLSTLKSYR